VEQDTFGFILHPVNIRQDVGRKVPILAKLFNEQQLTFLSRFAPPLYLSQIEGVTSVYDQNKVTGWFVACPYTPEAMLSLPVPEVYNKLVACGKKAEKLGAKVLGLGAFAAVVGDAGKTIAERLDIPVTTGDSYTVYVAVDAAKEAARMMNIDIPNSTFAVVGATGAIGGACAEILAKEVGKLILVGRRDDAVQERVERCQGYLADVEGSTSMDKIYNADVVITVTSAVHAIIEPQHLKPGAVVLDVARPRDVSRLVEEQRDDVLVIEGGMVEVPGDVNFNFNFGFPEGKAFACMAETMALALDKRYESYTIGKELTLEQIMTIGEVCTRHGFKLSGFRSFEQAVSVEHIDGVRERAARNLRHWSPVASS